MEVRPHYKGRRRRDDSVGGRAARVFAICRLPEWHLGLFSRVVRFLRAKDAWGGSMDCARLGALLNLLAYCCYRGMDDRTIRRPRQAVP